MKPTARVGASGFAVIWTAVYYNVRQVVQAKQHLGEWLRLSVKIHPLIL